MDRNWLFSPLSFLDFEQRYFQREVMIIRRGDPHYYRDLLSLDDLDTILATHNVSHPEVSMVKHGEDVARASYTTDTGRIDPLRAARLFNQGCTLIFTQLHSRLPRLGRLCADLEYLLSQRMQTNIYLTPAGAQGFAPHWDTHDVFVLQITGRKHWTTYESKVDLPTRAQRFDPATDVPGAVTNEFELAPGDMVYIPRGVMHSARANEETSLHITTGIVGYTWADALLQAVAAAALDDVSLRESLPLGWARDENTNALASMYLTKVEALLKHVRTAEPPFDQLAGDLTSGYASLTRGVLKRAVEATQLSASTIVGAKDVADWKLRQEGDACFVQAGARHLQLPARVLPILQFLAHHPPGPVADLPQAIDEAGKLVLVRRLITEGLLECA